MKEPQYVLVDTSSLSDGEFPNRWHKVVNSHRWWEEGVLVRHSRRDLKHIPADSPDRAGAYFFPREILTTAKKWPPRG